MEKKKKELLGVGRRKTAVAVAFLRNGTGKINVNGDEFEKYFFDDVLRRIILSPFSEDYPAESRDIFIRTKGGGVNGQATAARLAISRALLKEDLSRKDRLKSLGFLTRDPRQKERNKPGLAKARKRFQFSKR